MCGPQFYIQNQTASINKIDGTIKHTHIDFIRNDNLTIFKERH